MHPVKNERKRLAELQQQAPISYFLNYEEDTFLSTYYPPRFLTAVEFVTQHPLVAKSSNKFPKTLPDIMHV